jgi:putative membrane protein insertion efficiency factor
VKGLSALLKRLAQLPIRIYRRFLSPLKPPTCRFHPTCSQYALEAIELHGVLRGTFLGLWRLLRCNPLSRGGPDPVPPPRRRT